MTRFMQLLETSRVTLMKDQSDRTDPPMASTWMMIHSIFISTAELRWPGTVEIGALGDDRIGRTVAARS